MHRTPKSPKGLTLWGLYYNGRITLVEGAAWKGTHRVLISFLEAPDEQEGQSRLRPLPAGDIGHRLGLCERELEVLVLVQRGLPNREIAGLLDISEGTVKNHVTALLRKLNARNRTEAVYVAVKLGLLSY
jgi:DNA-binding NarL/FixJ family response regulator